MPTASRLPKGSRHRRPIRKPGPGERREGADDEGRADQPELVADDREDHVGVRLREVEHLGDALAEARFR